MNDFDRLVPPTTNHLARLYHELGKIGARSVGSEKRWSYSPRTREDLFLLAAELSRWDPRLLEILFQFSLEHWKTLIPQNLREKMTAMPTPQTVGVLAAFVETAGNGTLRDAPCAERILFWDYVVHGLKPVSPQFYFRQLYDPGTFLAERAAKESLAEFRRWGFLGRERLIADPTSRRTAGTWNQPERLNILRRLFSKRKTLAIGNYLEEIHHTVSRQQALLDLKKLGAKPAGGGRSAVWKWPMTTFTST